MSDKQSLWLEVLGGFLLIALFTASGCSPSLKEIDVGMSDNGSQVHLEVGQLLVVTLESNPTTGFRWEVAELDEGILKQTGEAEFVPESEEPIPGMGGIEIFRFEAAAQGEVMLKMVYLRPWEEGVEPLEVFSISVVVK